MVESDGSAGSLGLLYLMVVFWPPGSSIIKEIQRLILVMELFCEEEMHIIKY